MPRFVAKAGFFAGAMKKNNEGNHRWTQMRTDKGRLKAGFRSSENDHQLVSRHLDPTM